VDVHAAGQEGAARPGCVQENVEVASLTSWRARVRSPGKDGCRQDPPHSGRRLRETRPRDDQLTSHLVDGRADGSDRLNLRSPKLRSEGPVWREDLDDLARDWGENVVGEIDDQKLLLDANREHVG
jgi:hypothetical protein